MFQRIDDSNTRPRLWIAKLRQTVASAGPRTHNRYLEKDRANVVMSKKTAPSFLKIPKQTSPVSLQ